MRTGTRLVWSGITVALALAVAAGAAWLTRDAGVDEAFTIDRVVRVATLQPDGSLAVTEQLDVTFAEARRGIFRDLEGAGPAGPVRYDVAGVDQGRDDEPWPWRLERTDAGDPRVRIGDPSVALPPGPQRYRLRYEVDGLLFAPRDQPDVVELRLDVPGDGWPTTVAATSLQLDLPAPPTAVRCVWGRAGATTPCPAADVAAEVVVQTVPPLAPFETATVSVLLPRWSVAGAALPTADVRALELGGLLPRLALPAVPAALLLALVLALPAAALEAVRAGVVSRDRVTDPALHDARVPTAELTPPDGLAPAELAALLRPALPPRDTLLATVLDLELRGVLRTRTIARGPRHPHGDADDERTAITIADADLAAPRRPWEERFRVDLVPPGGELRLDGSYDRGTQQRIEAATATLQARAAELLHEDGPYVHAGGSALRGTGYFLAIVLTLAVGTAVAFGGRIVLGLPPVAIAVTGGALVVAWAILAALWWHQRRPLTSEGRHAVARGRAYRTFLAEVHGDRLAYAATRPEYGRTHPALALLPDAMALGLADAWYARFEPLLAALARPGGDPAAEPWYLGRGRYAAVAAAYAGSTTAPSTSGGAGGGGGGGSFGGGGAGSGGGGGGGGSW